MWLLVGATNSKDRVRVAHFTSEEKARNFLESNTMYKDGQIRHFRRDGLLSDYVWIKVEYEELLPIDPVW